MNKQLNPNWVAGILLGITLLILTVLPVRIVFNNGAAQEQPVVQYTLRTILGQTPPMAFIGVGGDIDGVINPTLTANVGDRVEITVINGDPVLHDVTIAEFGLSTGPLQAQEQQGIISFTADKSGEFVYFCSTPGHREVGMAGTLKITGGPGTEYVQTAANQGATVPVPEVKPADPNAVSIVHSPTDLPAPIGNREPTLVRVDLTAQEVSGILAEGTTFSYFTFNGTVPGPMLRVRVGDTVELHLRNETTSTLPHSIDLHAVTGPGGGAVFTQTNPGQENTFTFKALIPGLYVYHCATPSVPHHIANGMYGLILVEPEGGLPPVDREFYVMQGEIYTVQPFGTPGHLDFSHEKLLNETPEYYVFNGAVNALAQDEYALRANVGETVRIFFGVGGPNKISSFHVIGEIFDRVYDLGGVLTPAMSGVQTTLVPPGGATIVEFGLEVPGRYILVDHALSRLERGLAGYLYAEGAENPEIFSSANPASTSGH